MFDVIDKTDNQKLVELETIIEEGLRTFTAVGSALLQIRDGKLYQPQYSSFEEYCQEKWDMDHSHAYRLMNSAQVVENLKSSPIGELLPANEAQARPLASLPPEQQVEAWNKAVESAPKGKTPTSGLVQKIVDRFRGTPSSKRIKTSGWSAEEVKKDEALFEALTAIAKVYGNEDTKAIRKGIDLTKADILYLSKLPAEKMRKIQDLIFANHWTPEKALRFIERKLDGRSTVEELQNRCLATKNKFFSVVIGGFTHTCESNRKQTERN